MVRYCYIAELKKHLYEVNGKPYLITSEQLSEISRLYVKDGEDLQQAEVCAKLGMTLAELSAVLNQTPGKISKASAIWTFEEMLELSEEELIEQALKLKMQSYRSKLDAHIKHTEKLKEDRKGIFMDRVIEALREEVDPDRIPFKYAWRSHSENPKAQQSIMFALSDWHVGQKVELRPESLSNYDQDVFSERVLELVNRIRMDAERRDLLSKEGITSGDHKVIIALLGDILDGALANMHKEQAQLQHTTGIDQIKLAVDAVVTIIMEAYDAYKRPVEVFAVGGNHDRLTKDRGEDFFRLGHQILMEMIRLRLAKYIDEGLVIINATNARWIGFNITDNCRVMLNHGDNNVKPERLCAMDSRYHKGYKVIVQGHLHKRSVTEGNNHMHIIVPSLVGGSEFADYSLCLASRPGQFMLEVTDCDGELDIQTYWIDL